jgi:hypothetical protein
MAMAALIAALFLAAQLGNFLAYRLQGHWSGNEEPLQWTAEMRLDCGGFGYSC